MSDIRWRYAAQTTSGKLIKGHLMAANEQEALRHLKRDAISPVRLSQVKNSVVTLPFLGRAQRTLSLSEQTDFVQGLSDLLGAGVPLAEGLALLSSRAKSKKVASYASRILGSVRAGSSLTEALEQDEVTSPRLMLALVSAGEKSGTLAAQLARLAISFSASLKLRRTLIAQLAYPVALMVLIGLTLLFLSFFVLPQFEGIFENSTATPPPETQFVLAAGAFIRAWWPVLPVICLGMVLVFRLLMRQHSVRISGSLLRAPLFGPFLQKLEAGRYARSLGAMLEGGTSLAIALPIARRAVSSPALRTHLSQAETQVRAGRPLARALVETGHVPDEIIRFAEIGERTGRLGSLLLQGADLCERDIARSLQRITALLGPALTALMGLVTAAVIASVMSGVLSLNEAVY